MIRSHLSPPSSDHSSLDYRIGEFNVSVTSELDEFLEEFAVLYQGYSSRHMNGDKPIRVSVRRGRRSLLRGERYRILGDSNDIGRERRRDEVIPFVEWGINWCVISTRADFLQLHAATMAYDGKGVVLAAGSGGGKSTLVAGLMARGWSYLSDEFALVNPNTLNAHAFPKAVCVKAGAFKIIRELGLPFAGRRYYVKGLKGRVGYINPREVDGGTIGDPTPIRLVIFPKYTPGRRPRPNPITRGNAVFALAGSALNRHVFSDQGVSVLSRVVRGADCFGIDSGSLAGTCDLIETLMGTL
jgi:HprK-related kinase A